MSCLLSLWMASRAVGAFQLTISQVCTPVKLMAKEYVEERDSGYYVAGTRVSLDSIVQCFNEGLSPEAILGEFETLTLAQVFGAITFYLENQPAIDSYRMRQKLRFEALRRASAPLPPELRERLDAAREHLHSRRSD